MRKRIFQLAMAFAVGTFIFSLNGCSEEGKSDKSNNTEVETEGGKTHAGTETPAMAVGKQYSSAYVCPMHCEGSGSDAEGNCPACGMDYVALASHQSDGHTHEAAAKESHDHDHDHDHDHGHEH